MSKLQQLPSITTRTSKRLGRGYGSGKGGHTSSRGMKGQNSRNGGSRPLWFEGGQLPLIKRLPMWRGKGRLESLLQIETITLSELNRVGEAVVTVDTLKLKKVIKPKTKQVKVVARGSLTSAVTVKGIAASQKARQLIESAGGSVVE